MSHPDPVSSEIAELLEHSALCSGWAEQDEGPYHRDIEPVRRDIAEDRPGRDTTNDTDTIYATGGTPAVFDVTRSASG